MLPHGGVKQSGWVRFEPSQQHSTNARKLTLLTGPLQRTMGSGGIPQDQDRHLRRVMAPTAFTNNHIIIFHVKIALRFELFFGFIRGLHAFPLRVKPVVRQSITLVIPSKDRRDLSIASYRPSSMTEEARRRSQRSSAPS